jgi:hypothetical protein
LSSMQRADEFVVLLLVDLDRFKRLCSQTVLQAHVVSH